ncbi:TIGR04086 family membrane protein [Paenibacillus sp. ACRRX]|uniref:TIGR04086 family membrane protein n=1 Tax=Paenibacillus sp. ACRRX TaxID=2918206 RepID=UPI001EF447CA|nr:TIGR04086 family membrane protein [Paenibacillus sp. ACRRX]MCG7410347.1 TIGR04086 family membrane protein [Paenibacillus sp. ACRRX]
MNAIQKVSNWKMNPIFAGICYGFVWLALGALTLSVLLAASSASEDNMKSYTYIIHGFALLVAGWTAGRRSGKKGWYYGGITGLLYLLIVLIIGFLAMDVSFNWNKLLYILLSFGVAALGGIAGVNTKKHKK